MAEEPNKAAAVVTEPTKTLSWEEFYAKTDNGNKLMDRVWYCIGSTEVVSDQKVFWEHWYWNEGEGDGKPLDARRAKVGSNHTLTISTEGKEVDYPVWPLSFTTDSMKMYPAIDLKCMAIAPFGLSMQRVMFPADDSPTEFRVDYCNAMGKKLYFVFALSPNVPEEDKARQFGLLESEFGVSRAWFNEVSWDPNYKRGSTGEPDINPK